MSRSQSPSQSQSTPPTFTPESDPSFSSSSSLSIPALARFEFEAGKANDGTKILMIEWEDDDLSYFSSGSDTGSWHVSWEGKKAVLPADDDYTASESTRRVYFLLPPEVPIPPVVALSYDGGGGGDGRRKGKDFLQLNPLPAIFPPELGATGTSAGKKGVLHTIWAKKRLQSLDREIRSECLHNVEGIALHMALQEKEWIVSNFGVGIKHDAVADASSASDDPGSGSRQYPMGPTTPVSPTAAGKLGEKLKGLKLRTSERELSGLSFSFGFSLILTDTAPNTPSHHLLSPQSPDVAVSSFTSFHSIQPGQSSVSNHTSTAFASRTVIPQYPPESIAQQSTDFSGFTTMNSLARTSSADSGEGLFAKALSPRSPDLPRSPFSFAAERFG